MNVPQRQEEILKQMCVEINGVVITNLDALHSNRSEKRAPDDCLLYWWGEPPGDGRKKRSENFWIQCMWCTWRSSSSLMQEYKLIGAVNSSSLEGSIFVKKKKVYFLLLLLLPLLCYLASSLIYSSLRKRTRVTSVEEESWHSAPSTCCIRTQFPKSAPDP